MATTWGPRDKILPPVVALSISFTSAITKLIKYLIPSDILRLQSVVVVFYLIPRWPHRL